MKSEDKNRQASPESIANLMTTMLKKVESSYQSIYIDMVLMEASQRGVFDTIGGLDRDYIEKVIRVHANVCYVIFSLCVQCRACLKSTLNVEKQYNIRRSIVTAHEIYKYLYGFTGKTTPWKEVYSVLQTKHPNECAQIATAAKEYLQQYAQESDGTLRDVAKHFSDNPIEFFKTMSQVDERSVTDRVVTALRYLQPIHMLLSDEIHAGLGLIYDKALTQPMPKQTIEMGGIEQNEKIETLYSRLEMYSGIVDRIMEKLDKVDKINARYHLDMTQSKGWTELTEDNVVLHVLYNYLDLLTTFLAIIRSECFAEYRQNLLYLVMSSHEGFKKLYGFDENKRSDSYWNRSIKKTLAQTSDEQIRIEAEGIEARLNDLAQKELLKDENMIAVFTHVGTIKKLQTESSFAVLSYFIKKVEKKDIDVLTEYLFVLNDLVRLYTKVMGLVDRQIKQESGAIFARCFDMIDKIDGQIGQYINDEATLKWWREETNKIREMLRGFEKMSFLK